MGFVKRMFARRTAARRYRGNAVLDAALVLPILLAVAGGTAEFGYYFFVKHTLQGASRDGCRSAIVPDAAQTDVTTSVSNAMTAAGFSSGDYSVVTHPTDISTAASGDSVTVTVSANWGTVGVQMSAVPLISSGKTVAGVSVMRKE